MRLLTEKDKLIMYYYGFKETDTIVQKCLDRFNEYSVNSNQWQAVIAIQKYLDSMGFTFFSVNLAGGGIVLCNLI